MIPINGASFIARQRKEKRQGAVLFLTAKLCFPVNLKNFKEYQHPASYSATMKEQDKSKTKQQNPKHYIIVSEHRQKQEQ